MLGNTALPELLDQNHDSSTLASLIEQSINGESGNILLPPLTTAIESARDKADPPLADHAGIRLLLVVDQSEELFTETDISPEERERFVDALRGILGDLGGDTLFVASSDLSHVGPQFGEPRPVDDQRRMDVEQHDRDMIAKFLTGDPEEFLGAMRWNRNPTRWCSIGNMSALLRLAGASEIELIDYRQACDDRGMAMVSSAAMVLT